MLCVSLSVAPLIRYADVILRISIALVDSTLVFTLIALQNPASIPVQHYPAFGQKPNQNTFLCQTHYRNFTHPALLQNRKKPQWIVDEVLYLAAISGYGAGKVAELFNQRYGHNGDSVSKTFVYYQVKIQQYQIRILRRNIRNKPPGTTPVNQAWGIDLTTVTLSKQQRLVLGIVDHGSRLNLKLQQLKSKTLRSDYAGTGANNQTIWFPKIYSY